MHYPNSKAGSLLPKRLDRLGGLKAPLLSVLATLGCSAGEPTEKLTLGQVQQRTIVGEDDRTDVFEHDDPMWRELATRSTGLIVHLHFLDTSDPGDVTYASEPAGVKWGLCPEERFWSQPALEHCSGVLIADDLVLTAGHCIDAQEPGRRCSEMAFVFNYQMGSETQPPSLTADDHYECSEVVVDWFSDPLQVDYAVFRLDRPVSAPLTPAPVARVNRVSVGQPVTVIGHPLGWPTKIAHGVTTETGAATSFASYHTTLDLQGGNSGSAVFDNQGLIVGVLTGQAGRDYEDQTAACKTLYRVPEGENAGYVRYPHFPIRKYCAVTGEESELCGSLNPVCGDGSCDPHERDATCPADCAGVQPPEWTCSASQYNDGICECDCGAPDPACDEPQAEFPGCEFNEVCGSEADCGTTHAVPGRIEAVEFASFEEQTSNHSGDCNTGSPVDMQFTGDTDGSLCNIGWTAAGEWLQYEVNAEQAGQYAISLRLASARAGKTVRVEVDGSSIGSVVSPNNGWQSFSTVRIGSTALGAGPHAIRVVFETGSINLTYLSVDLEDSAEPSCTDGLRNGSETGVDCGGNDCNACPNEEPCDVDSDCLSQFCAENVCTFEPQAGGCTCPSGCGSVVNRSVPFTQDGSTDSCYFFSESFGNFINSWNNQVVNINGVDATNSYLQQSSYPTQQDGGYYLYVKSDAPWAHVEVR